jgi:hypothetical protein
MRKPVYADLGDFGEDERIAMIAAQVREGKVVSFITDDDVKADRYMAKLQRVIGVTLLDRGTEALGVKHTVWVKVGPITS